MVLFQFTGFALVQSAFLAGAFTRRLGAFITLLIALVLIASENYLFNQAWNVVTSTSAIGRWYYSLLTLGAYLVGVAFDRWGLKHPNDFFDSMVITEVWVVSALFLTAMISVSDLLVIRYWPTALAGNPWLSILLYIVTLIVLFFAFYMFINSKIQAFFRAGNNQKDYEAGKMNPVVHHSKYHLWNRLLWIAGTLIAMALTGFTFMWTAWFGTVNNDYYMCTAMVVIGALATAVAYYFTGTLEQAIMARKTDTLEF